MSWPLVHIRQWLAASTYNHCCLSLLWRDLCRRSNHFLLLLCHICCRVLHLGLCNVSLQDLIQRMLWRFLALYSKYVRISGQPSVSRSRFLEPRMSLWSSIIRNLDFAYDALLYLLRHQNHCFQM